MLFSAEHNCSALVNKLKAFLLLACLAAGTFTALNTEAATSSNSTVRFSLSYGTVHFGNIDVELFDQDRPITVSNFLDYAQSGAYDNSIIHRCDPDFIIQGGQYSVANPYSTNKVDFLSSIPEGAPIPGEYNVEIGRASCRERV